MGVFQGTFTFTYISETQINIKCTNLVATDYISYLVQPFTSSWINMTPAQLTNGVNITIPSNRLTDFAPVIYLNNNPGNEQVGRFLMCFINRIPVQNGGFVINYWQSTNIVATEDINIYAGITHTVDLYVPRTPATTTYNLTFNQGTNMLNNTVTKSDSTSQVVSSYPTTITGLTGNTIISSTGATPIYTLSIDGDANTKNIELSNPATSTVLTVDQFPASIPNLQNTSFITAHGKDDPEITINYTNTTPPIITNT